MPRVILAPEIPPRVLRVPLVKVNVPTALDSFHLSSPTSTTIPRGHRCQLTYLYLGQQILPSITGKGTELGLELRSDLSPSPLLSLHHIISQGNHEEITEENAWLHFNVGIDFFFLNELQLRHLISRTDNCEFLWASICQNLPEMPDVWRDDLRDIGFTYSSSFPKPSSWIAISSSPQTTRLYYLHSLRGNSLHKLKLNVMSWDSKGWHKRLSLEEFIHATNPYWMPHYASPVPEELCWTKVDLVFMLIKLICI